MKSEKKVMQKSVKSDKAALDDGRMWPTWFALKDLTLAEEAKICALVKKAVR